MQPDCLFCKIVAGDIPCHKIWEDEAHVAFLTLWPNTEGHSVVTPKQHDTSYFAEADPGIVTGLVQASREVARLLDSKYDDAGRSGMIFDGFGVDHLHAQVIPMHKTADDTWKRRLNEEPVFYEAYEGFITSANGPEMPTEKLEAVAAKIRG